MKPGYPNITGRPLEIIDNSLQYLNSNIEVKKCVKPAMGDSNGDCSFNIMDAAYIKIESSKALQPLNVSLDYDHNQVVDYADALFLVKVFYNLARFIKSVSVNIPHNKTDCKLKIVLQLMKGYGEVTSDKPDLYVAFTYGNNSIAHFMSTSRFEVGQMMREGTVTGNTINGVIVKAESDNARNYHISATTSHAIGKVGISIFQVLRDSRNSVGNIAISSSVGTKQPYLYSETVKIQLASNLSVVYKNGFSPMQIYNINTSTYLCYYPVTTKQ
ncbi:uncharacterized protein TRIADDRAFT_62730, partial [Trichoplax adhaerens]